MAYRSSLSSRGCGTCGGGASSSPAPSPAVYDPCAGGLSPVVTRRGAGCGCGSGGACGCGGSKAMVRTTQRTYDSERCPTFAISCETKQALRDCAKVAFCDLLRCVSETLCPDGQFDLDRFKKSDAGSGQGDATSPPQPQRSLQTELLNCVGQALCSFAHCVPQALCPTCDDGAPADCMPCDYAVEVMR